MTKCHYPKRQAKLILDGLRPQGGNRNAWWRKQWLCWVESLHLGARLGRGRNYAQSGQIKELDIKPGRLSARVQGAENTPYQLSISMPILDNKAVWQILNNTPIYRAQLAAHTFSISFAEFLQQNHLSIFPQGREKIDFRCSCKDWARPCKHLAAIMYLFADAIGANPLLLFRFRGVILPEETPLLVPTNLSPKMLLNLHTSGRTSSIPTRLGALPFWRGTEDMLNTLSTAYIRARTKTLSALHDQTVDFRFPTDIPAPIIH